MFRKCTSFQKKRKTLQFSLFNRFMSGIGLQHVWKTEDIWKHSCKKLHLDMTLNFREVKVVFWMSLNLILKSTKSLSLLPIPLSSIFAWHWEGPFLTFAFFARFAAFYQKSKCIRDWNHLEQQTIFACGKFAILQGYQGCRNWRGGVPIDQSSIGRRIIQHSFI